MKLSKVLVGASAGVAMLAATAQAQAQLSGNVGVVSEYYFRGVAQNETATGSAGVDYDFGNGFSVGTWAADVQDGLEYDVYGSYSGEVAGFGYSVGFTGYYYTGQFDVPYEEVNLSASYGPITVAYNIGSYDGDFDSGKTGKQQDYTFASVTAEYKGLYATYGSWGDDAEGDYVEVGYGKEVNGFDVGVAFVSGDDAGTSTKHLTTETTTMIFSLGTSFDIK